MVGNGNVDLRATVRYLVVATAGAAIGAVSSWYLSNRRIIVEPPATELEKRLKNHPALRYGMPDDVLLRAFTDYVVAFDTRLRNPRWVLEHINRDKGRGDANRTKSDFYHDREADPRRISRNDHYRGSGYDRGHMAPAANYKYSQQSMDETFSLLNMSPQVGKGFNRDYWARFEKFVKDLTHDYQDVFVVTGPLFLPRPTPQGLQVSYPVIGTPPELVAVPTHYFKVVLADAGDGSASVGAFVMPNAEIQAETPLTAFVVPLDALERVSGVAFFPQYVDATRRAVLDDVALDWQAHGKASLRAKAITGPDQPLLLTPPPAPETVPMRAPQPAGVGKAATTTKVVVRGASHLCDSVACKLPEPDFWKKGKRAGPIRDVNAGKSAG